VMQGGEAPSVLRLYDPGDAALSGTLPLREGDPDRIVAGGISRANLEDSGPKEGDEPTLFDGFIAVDPSVWWNEQAVVRGANPRLAWWTAGPKALYVATADEPDIQQGVAILVTALRIQAPAGVTWRHEPMPEEHHGTIFPTAALRGIRWMFAAPEG